MQALPEKDGVFRAGNGNNNKAIKTYCNKNIKNIWEGFYVWQKGRTFFRIGGSDAYWDGYGINSGRSMDNGANYTTYGTRNDNTGTTLGQDLEDTWDDLTGQDRKTKDKDSKAGSKTENNTNRVVD